MSSAQQLLSAAYEAARLENIKSNQAALLALGLTFATPNASTSATTASTKKRKASAATNKSAKKAKTPQQPARRSRRQQQQTPEINDGTPSRPRPTYNADGDEDEDEEEESVSAFMARKIERLKELHTQNMTAYKNPSATYEHTWMRVRTMTDKKLLVRVKVIERAMGQHCLVKMRMFAEVLILAGKDELAQAAQEALDRLLELAGKKHVGAGEKHVVHVVATPEEKKEAEDEEEKEKELRSKDVKPVVETENKEEGVKEEEKVELSKDKPAVETENKEKGAKEKEKIQQSKDKQVVEEIKELSKEENKQVDADAKEEKVEKMQPSNDDTPAAKTTTEAE